MSRYIPEDIIRDIKDRADIYEVISGYVKLQKSSGRWKGLCPFHHEKTPSFIVNTDNQAFHCFGCGIGGNVFTFIMEKEKVDFLEAAHILADRYNIHIPETNYNLPPEQVSQKDRLFKLHALATELYNKNLFSTRGKAGLDYLTQRGFTEDIINKFCIGFAPDSWDYMINQSKIYKYSEEELIASGLVVDKEENKNIYDRFRNRIIFPIWDERNRVIAFSARTIEQNPSGAKYVNSPETPIFKKSRVLYALPIAKPHFQEKGFAILCEGQIDVIAMHRAGFDNAIAPQGTAFTEEQAKLLKRYINSVYICFDGDTAGIKATLKAIDILLPLNFEIKVISLPQGEDPDNIFTQNGKEKIEEYVINADDFFIFIYNYLQKDFNPSTPQGKRNIVSLFLETFQKIENSVLRSSYISLLAEKLSLPDSTILAELNKTQKNKQFKDRNRSYRQEEKKIIQNTHKNINRTIAKAEEELLELTIQHGDVGRRLEEELPHELISNTPIGNALNFAISQTINGEWEFIKKDLSALLNDKPNNVISKVLTTPTDYPENEYNKAVDECMSIIKKHYLDIQITELMNRLKVSSIEERQNLLKEITTLQKEKLKS